MALKFGEVLIIAAATIRKRAARKYAFFLVFMSRYRLAT
jgi:hypothetical protein